MECHAQSQVDSEGQFTPKHKGEERTSISSKRSVSTEKTYVTVRGAASSRTQVQAIRTEAVRERKDVQRQATDSNGTPVLSRD